MSFLPLPLVTILTLLFPATGLFVGCSFAARPSTAAATYGLPPATARSPEAEPWIVINGLKTATGSLPLALLALAGQTRAVGVMLLCGVLQAWADALVVRRYNKGSEASGKVFGHFAGGVIMLVLGVWNLAVST